MITTNGWPDKPGVPLNPEKDGWHWLQDSEGNKECVSWRERKFLGNGRGLWSFVGYEDDFQPHEIRDWTYLGPVLTPDQATALQKRVAELEGRAVKWAGIVGTLTAERAQLIGVLQIAIERSGDLEPTPSWVDGACAILNRGFLKVDRAALTGGKDE